jgi:hypothetical protein
MGYGVGVLLLAVGLIMAFAINDAIEGVNLYVAGLILAAVGLLAIVLTAMSTMRSGGARTVATTTHADGSQTTTERRQETDPPATV